MVSITKGKDYVIWQENTENVPEPAILVEVYSDVVSMQQGAESINLNYETIDELCKLLKQIKNGTAGK